MDNAYASIEQAELKALREFYAAWCAFHKAKDSITGSEQFKRTRMERAAKALTEADHEVQRTSFSAMRSATQ